MAVASPSVVLMNVSSALMLAAAVVSTWVICTVRRVVRERDGIPPGACGACDDCCVSYWCGCCSLVQLLRQDLVTGETYRPCSVDATGETDAMLAV